MNKILRYSLIAILAFICVGVFADTTVTFTAGTDKPATEAGTFSKGGVTLLVEAGSSTSGVGKLATAEYRFYKGNDLTISSAAGNITKIVFTCTANGTTKWGPGCFAALDGYTFESKGKTGTWEGSAASVKFTASSNQVRAAKIEVTVADGGVSKSSANLAFSETTVNHEAGTAFTAPTFTKATTAAVTFASDNEAVAKVSTDGVISLGGEEGKAVITATSAENDDYYAGSATCTIYVYHMNVYKPATSIVSGKGYLLVAKRDDLTYYGYPLTSSAKHGYLKTNMIDGDVDEISIKSSYNDEFIFTEEGDGYSIKDNLGRYYIQQGTYKSFNTSETPAAWTVEAQGDGTYKISMNGYYMQFGETTNTTFGVYAEAVDNTVLPMLFELDTTPTGINNIATETTVKDAPLYNLAGQKVTKAYKGVVIQNGKKFVNK